jgi:hypothetical protein
MPAERYQLAVSGAARQQLERALHLARQAGKRLEGIRAARWILEELERTPMEFGESREHLDAMGVEVRVAFVRPLKVRFAVNEDERVVFVQRFEYFETKN